MSTRFVVSVSTIPRPSFRRFVSFEGSWLKAYGALHNYANKLLSIYKFATLATYCDCTRDCITYTRQLGNSVCRVQTWELKEYDIQKPVDRIRNKGTISCVSVTCLNNSNLLYELLLLTKYL